MSQNVRKAVILAAGLGTRFLPATKAIPKEMLPVIDKPVIQYIVEGLVDSGIKHIIIVTGWNKRAVEDHFDHPFELEYRLKETGKDALFEAQREIADAATFTFVRQKTPLGSGHAIQCAQHVIGDEPFLVQIGDTFFDARVPLAQQLLTEFEKYQKSILAAVQIPKELITRSAAIDAEAIEETVYRVNNIIEKPKLDQINTDLAQVGGYILTPDWFKRMEEVRSNPSNGEIWPTDAIRTMAQEDEVYAKVIDGIRYDCGNKIGYLKAIIDHALKRDDINEEIVPYLKQALNQYSS